jgi:hypothetical protein
MHIMHTCHKCYVANYNAAMVGISETQYCSEHEHLQGSED